jgi:hypothetical protein
MFRVLLTGSPQDINTYAHTDITELGVMTAASGVRRMFREG